MQLERSRKQPIESAGDPYLPALRRAAHRATLRDRIATVAVAAFLPEDLELLVDRLLDQSRSKSDSVARAAVEHSQFKTSYLDSADVQTDTFSDDTAGPGEADKTLGEAACGSDKSPGPSVCSSQSER